MIINFTFSILIIILSLLFLVFMFYIEFRAKSYSNYLKNYDSNKFYLKNSVNIIFFIFFNIFRNIIGK